MIWLVERILSFSFSLQISTTATLPISSDDNHLRAGRRLELIDDGG